MVSLESMKASLPCLTFVRYLVTTTGKVTQYKYLQNSSAHTILLKLTILDLSIYSNTVRKFFSFLHRKNLNSLNSMFFVFSALAKWPPFKLIIMGPKIVIDYEPKLSKEIVSHMTSRVLSWYFVHVRRTEMMPDNKREQSSAPALFSNSNSFVSPFP